MKIYKTPGTKERLLEMFENVNNIKLEQAPEPEKIVYVVADNDFNRAHYKDMIGKEFDNPPSYAAVDKINKITKEKVSDDNRNKSIEETTLYGRPTDTMLNKFPIIAVHLADLDGGMVKIGIFVKDNGGVNEEADNLKWVLYSKNPIITVNHYFLEKPNVGYIEGQTANNFITKAGYIINGEEIKKEEKIQADINQEDNNINLSNSEIPNDRLAKSARNAASTDIKQHFTKRTGSPDGFDIKNPSVYLPSEKWSKEVIPYDTEFTPDTLIKEDTDDNKYEDIIFLQGSEAFQPLELLDTDGPEAALKYLKQWHYPGEGSTSGELQQGADDQTFEKDGYIMTWNSNLDYIGLQYDTTHIDESISEIAKKKKVYNKEDMSHIRNKAQGNTENKEDVEHVRKRELTKKKVSEDVNNAEGNVEIGMDTTTGTGMNVPHGNNDFNNFQYMTNGKGKNISPADVDKNQLLVGIAVEKEHSDDSNMQASIALDHLAETPNYYTTLIESGIVDEQEALALAKELLNVEPTNSTKSTVDMTTNPNVDNTTENNQEELDTLLGFKPANVGELPRISELSYPGIDDDWTIDKVHEFMDEIGQDENIGFSDEEKLVGRSEGDFGKTRFELINQKLYITFETPQLANVAQERISAALGGVYDIGSRFDIMPKVIMVGLTE
jgi:hypothetical protein